MREEHSTKALAVTSLDGAHFELLCSATPIESGPCFYFMPAMGTRASYYKPLISTFAGWGINLVVGELRGHGCHSIQASRDSNFGYLDIVEKDIPAGLDVAKQHFPNSPIFVGGHSLGGQLSMLHLANHPDTAAGLVLVASGSPYAKVYRSRWRIFFYTQLLGLTARTLGYLPGEKMGFGGTEAKQLMIEWSRMARTGNYLLGPEKLAMEPALAAYTGRVLGVTLDGDFYAPPRATGHLLEKLQHAEKTACHLSREELGYKASHFNWVKQADRVAEKMQDWIGS